MRRVEDTSLWIGHVGDVRDMRAVHRAGIAAMVDLAVNEPPAAVNREMVYCRFPLVDGGGNSLDMLRCAVQTAAGLLRAGFPTLVFCSGGMSRSVSVGAAALAVSSGRLAEDCLRSVAAGGPADVSMSLWDALVKIVEESRGG
jgi:protein-tyrosine phosphatase